MPASRSSFPSLRLLPILFALLLTPSAFLPLLAVHAARPTAAYMHGKLSLSIPYHAAQGGSGQLVMELLDPEDHVLGRAEREVDVAKGDGAWQQIITPEKPIAFEDVIWQRVRYRFTYNDHAEAPIEGIESVSEILRRPVVHILGQSEYLAGSQAAIRVIVSDANHNEIPETGTVRIELVAGNQDSKKANPLFIGRLNRRGTLEAQFRFPAGPAGRYELHFIADTPVGTTEFSQPIELKDKAQILLTTEKPIYQPGQTIHIRALALDRANQKAASDRPLTFEVEDSRGNKVFKKITQTDSFGIASTEFSLADEVNLGTYHLRALMGDATAPNNTAEIALNVDRYVLPKFKVAIDLTEKDHKPKRDYRPGDHVTGIVHANYFFGKPVDHAEIAIKASGMDVAVFEAASASGKTDADGAYRFDLKLPNYFAGKPLSQGAARALVEATVKDSAAHSETRGEPITISDSPILITAVPEGGTLIPHLDNQLFILTSYPDGTPANTSLAIHLPDGSDQRVNTNATGIAVIHLAANEQSEQLQMEADDHHGNRTSTTVPLTSRDGSDQILLRPGRAILKTGDPIQLKLLSTRSRGTAYIDIVKNGQTILTRDVDIQNGEADLSLIATPEMAGTLDIDAYLFGRNAQPVSDHRLLFVQPADELKIEATADAAIYHPGTDANVRFHVTNGHGEGVSAALGVQVVDEAVFALAEKQPGFAKVFFYLEQEVMKPRYEIHSISLSQVVEPSGGVQSGDRDLAARALFSATEMAAPTHLDTEYGRSLPQDKFEQYQQRYQEAFVNRVELLTARYNQEDRVHRDKDFSKALPEVTLSDGSHAVDAWGTPVRVEPVSWYRSKNHFFLVRSAGPDRRFNTGDDLSVYVETKTGTIVGRPGAGGTVDLHIEHDCGPFNGLAEVSGMAIDQTGAVIPNAAVTLSEVGTGKQRIAHTNATGQFTLSALPAGSYKVRIAMPGFEEATRKFSLVPRDRAVISATLQVGTLTDMITVEDAVAFAAVVPVPAVKPPPPPIMGRVAGGIAMGAGMAMAAPMDESRTFRLRTANAARPSVALKQKDAAPAEAHVRSYFPEALYINPEILTDGHGNASISIPIADSITTWRMAMLASTQAGTLGTGTSSIKVFQDFFVDLDLPVTLTQGDRVSIPVAIYNYTDKTDPVALKLQPEDWYTLDHDSPDRSVNVEAGHVGGASFTLNAQRIGKFKLTLSASMEGGRQDVVVREIEVIPNGKEQNIVFNGTLEKTAQHPLQIPANAIPDASTLLVRLYPGPLSQVIEGMDSILRMPGGCFEQTSSSTYPNVLALDYMKRTKKLTPEVHAKAEGYIANGYQRLLTFEVPGGGFSWFGAAPANKILTSYGLMEFNDMAKVSDVDPKLIERTRNWLAQQQQPDGSWKPDSNFINEGATNRYNSNVLRITAYIAWALANTGYQGPAVERAKHYIEEHSSSKPDTYTLAVIANFAADYGKDREFTRRSMEALVDARTEQGDQVFWSVEETGVYSTGTSAAIETTGLAIQALLKWGQASGVARKALVYIASKKQASGNWGTTQATIMALRALLMASEHSASDIRGNVHVLLDGKTVDSLTLTPENNDLLHQFVVKGIDPHNPNLVQLKFDGAGSLAYQVVGRYFTPWEHSAAQEALSIDVAYDRTTLAQNDIATATATIHNNLHSTANMVMVDLGIPPGFDLQSDDLQTLHEKTAQQRTGRLEKFSQTANQAILYFNSLGPDQIVTVKFRLRAKYPIRAHTFQSRVYEYYDPAVSAIARPVQLEVKPR